MTTPQTRITVRISAALVAQLDACLKSLYLRRDAYLNHTLGAEVDDLAEVPPNSPRAQRVLRQLRGAIPDKARIAITLDTELVKRINEVCAEKGIVRDAFIESYIAFLVLGDFAEGTCISPLEKARAILSDPRHEYYSAHPTYIDLHLPEEDISAATKPLDLQALFREKRNEHTPR